MQRALLRSPEANDKCHKKVQNPLTEERATTSDEKTNDNSRKECREEVPSVKESAKETRKRSEDEAYGESLHPITGWRLALFFGV